MVFNSQNIGKTTRVKSIVPILLILALATAYGIWHRRTRGVVKPRQNKYGSLNEEVLGAPLGANATLVQFSTVFCTPCRATKSLLQNIVADLPGVAHIDIDAEERLELVRKLDIRSTPTTLFLDSQGLEVGRAVGAPNRAQVLTALQALH